MASNPIPNSQPFTKGDPRINRRGRPKTSEDLKALGLSLLHEPARDKDGNPVVIDGHVATNLEMVLRRMMQDKRQAADLLDRVFGKVPNAVDLRGKDGGPVEHIVKVMFGDQHPVAGADADASGDTP